MAKVSSDYLHSPRTVTTHGLVAFKVSDVWFCLQLFRTGTASALPLPLPVSAAAVVASAAAHLVPIAAVAFPSMYSALSSSASCSRTFLQAHLLLVLLEKDVGIDPSQVDDVIEDRHWSSSHTAFDGVCPRHLVRDAHAVLGVVVVHHKLWLCLHPTKGTHTCVHGAQDADILPRLSLLHSQSRITSAPNSSARCFTEGELLKLFANGANQAVNSQRSTAGDHLHS